MLSKLYAEDLVAGAEIVGKTFDLYRDCKEIMMQSSFNLRKWNSNDKELLKRIDLSEGQVWWPRAATSIFIQFSQKIKIKFNLKIIYFKI